MTKDISISNPKACALCNQTQNLSKSNLIAESKQTIFFLGSHAYYPGYCVAIHKKHVVEMHDLNLIDQAETITEVLSLSKAIYLAFSPIKMNLASLGNQDPHLHWHLFPRYKDDPNVLKHPWSNESSFDSHKYKDLEAVRAIEKIQKALRKASS
jgi:diadenosine tetraphosphate (Ap4A) HIT family hydrolase